MEQKREDQTQTETQEEEQEDAQESLLDQILAKVDLDSPLLVEDASGNQLPITKKQFMKYYLPKGASEDEQFHCFNQTKAAGLNPLIRGECHYPRFGDAPLSLFTGYPVYLRKAYENGLQHLECEFEFDDNGKPISVMTTLYISDRDKPFVWQTWYDEVEGQTKGQTNWRWKKAPKSQLRKCGVVDTLRYSGLLSKLNLPLILEEMAEPTMEGFKSLTREQASAHDVEPAEGEITIGEVNAADHQMDMTPFRKKYFAAIGARKMFESDEERKGWQKDTTGKESTSDWGVDEYAIAMEIVLSVPIPNPDPPSSGDDFLDALSDVPEEHREPEDDSEGGNDKPVTPEAPAETQDEQDDTTQDAEQDEKLTPETRATLTELVKSFPGEIYQTIRSQAFKTRARNEIGRWLLTISHLTEAEAQKIIRSLESEKAGILEEETTGEINEEDDEPIEDGMLTPEAAKAEAESQDQFAREQAGWFESDEHEACVEAYKIRVYKKWDDAEAMKEWQMSHTGIGSFRYWRQEHFALANTALDAEEAAAGNGEPKSTTPEDLADGEGKCTTDQYDKIMGLFAEWMPDKKSSAGKSTAHGTGEGQRFLRQTVKGYNGILMMTAEQANDVILALKDKLKDNEAETKTA